MTIKFYTYFKEGRVDINTWYDVQFIPRKDDIIKLIYKHEYSGIVRNVCWLDSDNVEIEVRLPLLN